MPRGGHYPGTGQGRKKGVISPDRKDMRIDVRVNKDQKDVVVKAAKYERKKISAFIREAALEKAKKILNIK